MKDFFVKMKSAKKQMAAIVCIIVLCSLLILVDFQMRNEYSIPSKEERLNNLLVYSGSEAINEDIIANDIKAALSKYTNWDNLFLSEHFKQKYKNRNNILDDVNDIIRVRRGRSDKYGENVIVIFADRRGSFIDTDETDDITTNYYFRYILDDRGEVDDLILLEKEDVYTTTGTPVTN
jgi:hypothetical protein